LLDVARETLFLVDGGACSCSVLAQSLRCSEADVLDLLHSARAELLAQLLETGCRDGRLPRPAMPGFRDIEDDLSFNRHLNVALYRALQKNTCDPVRLAALRQTIEEEEQQLMPQATMASPPSPSTLTRWLRLMFIAYAQGIDV
jgi:hypothetical protein